MDAAQFGEYLHLIGFKPTRCDLTALKTLLTRHMAALPFQTLSTVLGEPVRLIAAASSVSSLCSGVVATATN